jgi:hypothetical protein
LKPIEITLETSGCGRAWTNVQAGVNSSKHFPQTRLGKHYSRQKSSDTADQKKKKTLATFKTGGRNFKASLSFGWESSCPDNLCA